MWTRRFLAPALASSLGFLDSGATVIVLPAMGADLGLSLTEQQQVASVALLALGLLVLPGGIVGDLLSTTTAARLGLLLSAVGCALTVSGLAGSVVPGRVLFGAGAALFLPAALARVTDPASGGSALRLWTVTISGFTLAAPAIGAAAIALGGWQVLYVAEGVVALLLLLCWSGDARPAADRTRHVPRGAAVAAGLLGAAALTVLLTRPPGTALALGVLAGGAAAILWRLLAGRVAWPFFAGVQGLTLVAYAAFAGLPFLLSLYLQGTGLSVGTVGVALATDGVLVVLLTPVLGAAGVPLASALHRVALGAGLCAGGAAVLLLLPHVGSSVPVRVAVVVAGLAVAGVGSALFITPLTDVALRVTDRSVAGVAAGANLAVARLAAGVGLTALSTVAVLVAARSTGRSGDLSGNPFSGASTSPLAARAADAAYQGAMTVVIALFLVAAAAALMTARLRAVNGVAA